MDQPANCAVRLVSKVSVVEVVGELDIGNIHFLKEAIATANASGDRNRVVDLTLCTYFDSQTLHEFIRAKASMRPTGKVLHIVVPLGGSAKRILQILGVTEGLVLFNRHDEAIAASASNALV